MPGDRVELVRHELSVGCWLGEGRLPDALMPTGNGFEGLWDIHPAEYHEITVGGRRVRTPRWQQAYGVDYEYTGRVNKALAIPPQLSPFLVWAQEQVDPALNGLLLNWYDGSLGHYIGRHRDSTRNLIPGTPIVTISLGAERTFRLRSWPRSSGGAPVDFQASAGTIFIMPWETNRVFTHEVPPSRETGRRVSITARAFKTALAASSA